jgi:hypothetical protein
MELEDPDSNFLTEVEGIDYYDIDESLVNDLNRINYSYRFDENNISKSNFINSAYNTFILKRYDHDEDGENDYMLFTTDDSFNLFERLDNLESVKINITCHYEVISSNADEVNNNVYTWYLTRDSSKSINLVYNPDNEIDDRSFLEKIMDSYYFDISIVCLGVLIVGGIIYLIMKNRSEKVDRI